MVSSRVITGSTIHVDEASYWDILHARFDTKRINHSLAYSDGQSCTNLAESFFTRLRRSAACIHHPYQRLVSCGYAGEMDWRKDNRRVSNGEQFGMMVAAAMSQPFPGSGKTIGSAASRFILDASNCPIPHVEASQ